MRLQLKTVSQGQQTTSYIKNGKLSTKWNASGALVRVPEVAACGSRIQTVHINSYIICYHRTVTF